MPTDRCRPPRAETTSTDETKGLRVSPANPQELPDAAQTKPEIKRSQRRAHFHGLGGFPASDRNVAGKLNSTLTLSVADFSDSGSHLSFSLPALSAFTPPTTLSGLILKVLKTSARSLYRLSEDV